MKIYPKNGLAPLALINVAGVYIRFLMPGVCLHIFCILNTNCFIHDNQYCKAVVSRCKAKIALHVLEVTRVYLPAAINATCEASLFICKARFKVARDYYTFFDADCYTVYSLVPIVPLDTGLYFSTSFLGMLQTLSFYRLTPLPETLHASKTTQNCMLEF